MRVTLDIDLPREQVRAALNRVLPLIQDIDDDLVSEVCIAILFACEGLPLGELQITEEA